MRYTYNTKYIEPYSGIGRLRVVEEKIKARQKEEEDAKNKNTINKNTSTTNKNTTNNKKNKKTNTDNKKTTSIKEKKETSTTKEENNTFLDKVIDKVVDFFIKHFFILTPLVLGVGFVAYYVIRIVGFLLYKPFVLLLYVLWAFHYVFLYLPFGIRTAFGKDLYK